MKKAEIQLYSSQVIKDRHGNYIYYDRKHKIGYKIPLEKTRIFAILQYRYIVSVILFIALYILIQISLPTSIVLTIFSAILLEYRWKTLLTSLEITKNFIPPSKNKEKEYMHTLAKKDIVLRIVLYSLLDILLVVNAFYSSSVSTHIFLQSASFIVAGYALYMVYTFLHILYRKENGKN